MGMVSTTVRCYYLLKRVLRPPSCPMQADQLMFTGFDPIKESFKYSMETQFEANADTKIGPAAVEHHSNKSVLPKEDGADILHSFMSPPRPQKRTLFKKVRSSVRYIKETILSPTAKVCDCTSRVGWGYCGHFFRGVILDKYGKIINNGPQFHLQCLDGVCNCKPINFPQNTSNAKIEKRNS